MGLMTQNASPPYTVVAQTADWWVIDKAPGVSFHREGAEQGLFDRLRAELCTEAGDDPHAIHRLDKMTSGLLVIARNADVARRLSALWRERRVEKFYLALSDRSPKRKQGLVAGDMSPARRGAWKLESALTRPALTQFFSKGAGEGRRLFLLKPHTGRTHQIRVAMKSLGAPILGDSIYASPGPAAEDIDRGYLHAYALCLPWEGEVLRYTCPPAQGFLFAAATCRTLLEEWTAPWDLPWPSVPPHLLARVGADDA